MFKMKNLSLFLALGLVGLMYHTPNFLRELTNGLLGKVLLVVALAYITVQCDFSCAVIFALIIIVLLHNTKEGFEDGKKEKKEDEEEEDDEDEEDDKKRKKSPDEVKREKGEKRIKNMSNKAASLRKKGTSAAKTDIAVEKQEKKEKEKTNKKEPFAGKMISNVKDSLLHSYNEAQDIFKSNLLDLDRDMKVGAEKRSINATKQ